MSNTRNAVKLLMSLSIMGSGVILLFISVGYIPGAGVPIIESSTNIVDPIPHSFMLTSIVINLATTALGLALILRLYREYRTLDVKEMIGSDKK